MYNTIVWSPWSGQELRQAGEHYHTMDLEKFTIQSFTFYLQLGKASPV